MPRKLSNVGIGNVLIIFVCAFQCVQHSIRCAFTTLQSHRLLETRFHKSPRRVSKIKVLVRKNVPKSLNKYGIANVGLYLL